ncbi:hypothetical protein LTR36_009849 [Oleoguttula mirabilis]|uniref:Uncharacterized protein n=1 Tax=Oleoguttula mirabilis TaxID=1507867 RepID=A0AAV9J6M6_9PEZI|nr:hypothetical protein LTR36_009849 [Oleoguttula mirabilis]
MSLVILQPYELPIVTKLYRTYNLNTAAGDGMTPNPNNAFRRWPTPDVMPHHSPDDNKHKHIQNLLQLPFLWEGTLYQLKETRIYDGSEASSRRFAELTGLSPLRFAQAWLECHGSIWRYYHPCTAKGGPAVAEAMCEFWAVKVKHWASIPEHVAKANVFSKIGGGAQGLELLDRLMRDRLGGVMSVNGKGPEFVSVLRLLEITASPDCPAHPVRAGVQNPFLHVWTAKLAETHPALLYTGDAASAVRFTAATGTSQTVAAFAESYVDGMSEDAPFWTIPDRPALIEALLALWADVVRHWRATCKTRREARTKLLERLKEEGNVVFVPYATGTPTAVDLHKNDIGQEDPLCRYVRIEGSKPGHQHTVVLYAKSIEKGEFGYDVLRKAPCHEACGFEEGMIVDVAKVTAPFLEEDGARALAVKVEW